MYKQGEEEEEDRTVHVVVAQPYKLKGTYASGCSGRPGAYATAASMPEVH